MPDSNGRDRREHARIDTCTTAVVLARHNDGVAFLIESISVGGARLAGPLTLDKGEQVSVMFEIHGRPIEVRGEVVRVERRSITEDGVAVRFLDLAGDDRRAVHDLVLATLEAEAETEAGAGVA